MLLINLDGYYSSQEVFIKPAYYCLSASIYHVDVA